MTNIVHRLFLSDKSKSDLPFRVARLHDKVAHRLLLNVYHLQAFVLRLVQLNVALGRASYKKKSRTHTVQKES